MAIKIADKTLIKRKVAPPVIEPPKPDPHKDLLDALVNSQRNTDSVLLLISKQLTDLKEPKAPVDVMAKIIRDKDDKITAIHITDTKK